MRRDGKSQTPWKRKNADPLFDPKRVFDELARRQMRDLETCRLVWEQEGDPLALCEAVRQSDIPDWLASSLLVMLTEGVDIRTNVRLKAWRARTRHARDAVRAHAVAGARSHPELPQTWELSYVLGEHFTRERFDDLPSVSPAAMKKAYERVSKGIWEHPNRYYSPKPGMAERIRAARTYMLAIMKEALARATSAKK